MGLATAQLLSSRGAAVSLADLNAEALEAALKSVGGESKHMAEVVNVADSESVEAWIAKTIERFGKLDGAVNMAGVITPAKPITEQTGESWDFVFSVNARGIFNCLRAQLRAMGPGGSIVSCDLPFLTDLDKKSRGVVEEGMM